MPCEAPVIGVNMAYHQALETENFGHPIIRWFIVDVKKSKNCLILISWFLERS